MPNSKRPNMSAYFRARIDHHVFGMMSTLRAQRPSEVKSIVGDVTDRVITVTTLDGTEWQWRGGRYAARKVNGCYAPLMPTPVNGIYCPTCRVSFHDTCSMTPGCPCCDETIANSED